jgi:hypothetical protein
MPQATRLRLGLVERPPRPDGDELGRALAVARDGLRELVRPPRPAAASSAAAARRRDSDALGARRAAPLVAISTKESLVEVSPSTVMRLKLASATCAHERGRSTGCATRRVGGNEAEHGRHVRLDHARALGDAGDRDRTASSTMADVEAPLGRCRWS